MQSIDISVKDIVFFNNLDNDGKGSLRDVVSKKLKKSIIKPIESLNGKLFIKSRLEINNFENVIFDFESRVEIRGWGIDFRNCENIYLTNIIHRTTDVEIRKHYKNKRPANSVGLDCFNLSLCKNFLISKCSLWSSCDEIVSVVNCEDIHFESCFIAFPLSSSETHPYGKEHAECSNNSASNYICYFRCVFAYYRMRGPMFETKDISEENYDVKMQVVNCIMYGFTQAGTKYHSWIEKDEQKLNPKYKFQILNNIYVNPKNSKKKGYPIVCDSKRKTSDQITIGVSGNKSWDLEEKLKNVFPCRSDGSSLDTEERMQIRNKKIIKFKCLENIEDVSEKFFFQVLEDAGVNDSFDVKAKSKMKSGEKWQLFEKFSDVEKFLN